MKRDKWRGYKRTQRAYPLNGHRCEVEGCDRPAEHRHHVDGDTLNTGPENVVRLCMDHHGVFHPSMLNHGQIVNVRDRRLSASVVASLFGISISYVNAIRRGDRLRV